MTESDVHPAPLPRRRAIWSWEGLAFFCGLLACVWMLLAIFVFEWRLPFIMETQVILSVIAFFAVIRAGAGHGWLRWGGALLALASWAPFLLIIGACLIGGQCL